MSFENAGLVICNPIHWQLASSGFPGDSKGRNRAWCGRWDKDREGAQQAEGTAETRLSG